LDAFKKLESLRSIIITGEPGIGKTTLADHLCLHYIINEYEFCFIEESISEAEALYDKDRKQVFYFDDFLGRNYLHALDRHEDSHVINFMKRVSRGKNKRFILTSRTSILNQGKRLSDLFRIENIDRNEYELNIRELSNFDKAKILYNHIWFSNLSEPYIEELYKYKRYKEIIMHANYNPRLISFITDVHKVLDIHPKNYWSYIEDTLDNPADIWGHVFDNQLGEHSRVIVSLVVFNGKEIKEENLIQSFLYLVNEGKSGASQYGVSDFYTSIKLAVGAVINRKIEKTSSAILYDLFNPAIGDYLLRRYSGDQEKIYKLFESLNTKESLANISNLFKSGIIDKDIFREVLNRLLVRCLKNELKHKTIEYTIRLVNLSLDHIDLISFNIKEMLHKWLRSINFSEIEPGFVYPLTNLLTWSLKNNVLTNNEFEFEEFFDLFLDEFLDHEDYLAFSKLIFELGSEYVAKYSDQIKAFIIEYWQDTINDEIDHSGALDGYLYDEEESAAKQSVYELVAEIFSDHPIVFDHADIESICAYCDIWQFIEKNRESEMWEDEDSGRSGDAGYSSLSEDSAIDDLFERT
jgi:adenylate kinase family enzyme